MRDPTERTCNSLSRRCPSKTGHTSVKKTAYVVVRDCQSIAQIITMSAHQLFANQLSLFTVTIFCEFCFLHSSVRSTSMLRYSCAVWQNSVATDEVCRAKIENRKEQALCGYTMTHQGRSHLTGLAVTSSRH